MKIIIKEPGKAPEYRDIQNKLEELQNLVDGYIETITFDDDCVLICNEEGRLRDLPWNCRLFTINFFGTVLFVGVDGEDFTDCPLTIKDLKDLYEVE
jgi:hypothetical protein